MASRSGNPAIREEALLVSELAEVERKDGAAREYGNNAIHLTALLSRAFVLQAD
jgi:hypothetical protein